MDIIHEHLLVAIGGECCLQRYFLDGRTIVMYRLTLRTVETTQFRESIVRNMPYIVLSLSSPTVREMMSLWERFMNGKKQFAPTHGTISYGLFLSYQNMRSTMRS